MKGARERSLSNHKKHSTNNNVHHQTNHTLTMYTYLLGTISYKNVPAGGMMEITIKVMPRLCGTDFGIPVPFGFEMNRSPDRNCFTSKKARTW